MYNTKHTQKIEIKKGRDKDEINKTLKICFTY